MIRFTTKQAFLLIVFSVLFTVLTTCIAGAQATQPTNPPNRIRRAGSDITIDGTGGIAVQPSTTQSLQIKGVPTPTVGTQITCPPSNYFNLFYNYTTSTLQTGCNGTYYDIWKSGVGAVVTLNNIQDPTTAKTFSMGVNTNEFTFNTTSSPNNLFTISENSANVSHGYILHVLNALQAPTAKIARIGTTLYGFTWTYKSDGSGNYVEMAGGTSNTARIKLDGLIESTTGGFKFPDGTTQTTAASGGLSAWEIKSTNFTAIVGHRYQVDTSGGAVTVTLPASASVGNEIVIEDATLSWDINNLTLNRNGLRINGDISNYTANVVGGKLSLVYIITGYGWSIK